MTAFSLSPSTRMEGSVTISRIQEFAITTGSPVLITHPGHCPYLFVTDKGDVWTCQLDILVEPHEDSTD